MRAIRLTPLCKYYATEISNDVTRKGIQVHGRIGYMLLQAPLAPEKIELAKSFILRRMLMWR